MTILETAKHKITGEPRVKRDGDRVIMTATHRLPSGVDEQLTALRIVTALGAVAVLVAHYRPEVALPPDRNVMLDNANTVIVGLANAVGKLGEVFERQTLDVPLESLRGWMLASAVLGAGFVFRHSGLFDLYTWLTNREHVTITVDAEHLSVRRGTFGLPKRIARDTIRDVLILPNHRTGHDVMVQHEGGLTRLASIYGDLTRPTLMRLRLKEALADIPRSRATTVRRLLHQHN
ncbi:MAG: hypothetical protein GW798_08290 [Roseovarius sp.]|nr:hypothetical protein [Roseovarius sp.]